MNPHLWRTHDGGRTWTEINNGIAAGAVTNTIREDARVKGLLYAGTDTQVWVSYDDGDHWQSLRINMPAISVRDLELKDDSTCLCSDLIAGTHGRGFWILDDVTPLRAIATMPNASSSTYLVKPATAVRVRFAENDPTPWPPEVPAGENPPAGAVIDYRLAANAGSVRLEIVDAGGKKIRTYSSADTIPGPDPAWDPEAYNRICQRNTSAPHCSVPLYWSAPNPVLSAREGAHRFVWDMRFDPVEGTPLVENNPVPHRTYLVPATPWAPPGEYTVRLTVNGKTYSQLMKVVLDPRVKTSPSVIAQISSLSREMYDDAVAVRKAYSTARQMSARLTSTGDAQVKAKLDSLAPAAISRPTFGAPPAPSGPPTLESVRAALMSAAMSLQNADVAPTTRQLDAIAKARADYREVMARWNAINK
jgi:hypothetical protein